MGRFRILTQAECDRLRRLCEVHTMGVAAEIVGCGKNAVTRAKKRGWKAYKPDERPRPSDFAWYAAQEKIIELRRRYGASQQCVERWSREIGRKNMPGYQGPPRLPCPPDLVQKLAELPHLLDVAKHYGVHRNTLLRWRVDLGLYKRPEPTRSLGWVEQFVQSEQYRRAA